MHLVITRNLYENVLGQIHTGNYSLAGLDNLTQYRASGYNTGHGINTLAVLTGYGGRCKHLLNVTHILHTHGIGTGAIEQDILNVFQLSTIFRSVTYLNIILLTVLAVK